MRHKQGISSVREKMEASGSDFLSAQDGIRILSTKRRKPRPRRVALGHRRIQRRVWLEVCVAAATEGAAAKMSRVGGYRGIGRCPRKPLGPERDCRRHGATGLRYHGLMSGEGRNRNSGCHARGCPVRLLWVAGMLESGLWGTAWHRRCLRFSFCTPLDARDGFCRTARRGMAHLAKRRRQAWGARRNLLSGRRIFAIVMHTRCCAASAVPADLPLVLKRAVRIQRGPLSSSSPDRCLCPRDSAGSWRKLETAVCEICNNRALPC